LQRQQKTTEINQQTTAVLFGEKGTDA